MRTLDTRQLLAFWSVARRQSFTRAAKDLNLSQSAVSHAMRALEQELGCRLLNREARSVALTPAGEKLLLHVEAILREMDAARNSVQLSSAWEHGSLKVGASMAACQHILPVVLREFRESFPKCSIKVEPGDQAQQYELLQSGRIDVAILLQPTDDTPPEVTVVPLFEDELCFFVSPHHPWAQLNFVPTASIRAQLLVLYTSGTYTFDLVQRYFAASEVEPSNVIELGSMDAIKEMAKLGVGAGIFAPWIASSEIESGILVPLPLGRAPLRRKWCVAFRSTRRLALAEQTFVGLCQAVADNLNYRTVQTLADKRSA
ncbi:MAG TPA: LysR family transcriptional regulator [Opitutaceae bacterium]|jgi:DNA-binding transcriptional LysR family regulator